MATLETLPYSVNISRTATTRGRLSRYALCGLFNLSRITPFHPQIFILDERIYPSESLVDQSLRGSQGPALVAINDGVLEPADWQALQKIHSSSKIADET